MHTPRTIGLATALATVLSLACLPAASSNAEPAATPARTDTIIVTFDHGSADPAAAATVAVADAAQDIAGADVKTVTPIGPGMVAVTFDTVLSSGEQARLGDAVEDQPGVKAAEPDYLDTATGTGDPTAEPYWPFQWDMAGTWGIKAPQAWWGSTGAGAVVGVVDSGITPHPDLTGSTTSIVGGTVVAGYDFISWAGIALDGGGRDGDPTDLVASGSFHGTHVSGTIGAHLDGLGVVGTAPGVTIQPLRALGEGGGFESDIMAAMRWGAGLTVSGAPTNHTPVDVLNLSLGGRHACQVAMQDTINAVRAKGVPVVVSAGNSGIALSEFSPANCTGVIRVTATGATGLLTSYSNVGTPAVPASIAAPGGSELRTSDGSPGAIVSTSNSGTTGLGAPGYRWMMGTSMAAPHVSGVIALLKSQHRSLTPDQVAAILKRTASPLATACDASVCGAGIVDAAAAVADQAPAPPLPVMTATKSPSIAGTPTIDRDLTGDAGTWSATATLATRWLRDNTPIAGATSATHRTTTSDVGHVLTFEVTASRTGYAPATVRSAALRIKQGALRVHTSPSVSGTRKVGHRLSGKTGSWTPAPSLTRHWLRDGRPIAGATGSTYRLTKADRGHRVQLRVTAARTGYTTKVVLSPADRVR